MGPPKKFLESCIGHHSRRLGNFFGKNTHSLIYDWGACLEVGEPGLWKRFNYPIPMGFELLPKVEKESMTQRVTAIVW